MAGAVRELITKVKFAIDNSSLSKVNTEIRKLKKALSGIDTKEKNIRFKTTGLETATRGILRAKSELKALNGQIATVHVRAIVDPLKRNTVMGTATNQARMGAAGAFSRARDSAANVGSSVAAAAAAYGGYVGASQITDTADAMMSLDGRLRTVTKSEEERLAIESELYSMGQKTRQQMVTLGDLYYKVARSSEEMGFSQKENLRVTETVSKALIVGGASAAEASATILQLGQALGSGRLQGDELRSLDENASALMRHVAKYFGTTVAGLKAMGAAGELTSAEVMKAILYASEEIDKEFMQMPMTFGQAMNVMGNSWDKFILGVEQKSNVFSMLARGAAKAFESVGNQLNDFATLMGTPDANKTVTITDAATGETREISELDYFNQKAEENPGMVKTVNALKDLGEWIDRLDGKMGNMDEQIAGWIESFMKIAVVVAPILAVVGAISAIITIVAPFVSAIVSFGKVIFTAFQAVLGVIRFLLPVVKVIGAAIAGLGATTVAIIAAVVAAIVLLVVYWDEVKQAAIDAWNWFIQGGESAVTAIQEFTEQIRAWFQEVWKSFLETVNGIVLAANESAGNLLNAFGQAIDGVKAFFSDLFNHAMSILGAIGSAISGLINSAMEFIGIGSRIEGVNSAAMQRIWDSGTGQGISSSSSSTEQNYTFNVGSWGEAKEAYRNSMFVSDFG